MASLLRCLNLPLKRVLWSENWNKIEENLSDFDPNDLSFSARKTVES